MAAAPSWAIDHLSLAADALGTRTDESRHRVRQPEGRRGQDDDHALHRRGSARARTRRSVVDLDPQGALTYSLGYDPDGIEDTVNDVLVRRFPIEKAVIAGTPDLVPANIDLAGPIPFC